MLKEDKEKITALRKSGCSYTEIGKRLSIPVDTVRSFCRRNNIVVIKQENLCRECFQPIVQKPKTKHKIFCCKTCREKWWAAHPEEIRQKAVYTFTCKHCGKVFTAYGNSKRKYCSHQCYIKDRFGGVEDD